MESALRDSGLKAGEIDYLSAGALSLRESDAIESEAILDVFGSRIKDVPVTSNTSKMGHLFAAAEPVDIISAVLSMQENVIPPLINYSAPRSPV